MIGEATRKQFGYDKGPQMAFRYRMAKEPERRVGPDDGEVTIAEYPVDIGDHKTRGVRTISIESAPQGRKGGTVYERTFKDGDLIKETRQEVTSGRWHRELPLQPDRNQRPYRKALSIDPVR